MARSRLGGQRRRCRKASALLACMLAALLPAACSSPPRTTTATSTPMAAPTLVTAAKPSATYVVHLLDNGTFEPNLIHAAPGRLVELVLVGDSEKHDFTSRSLNLDEDVPPHQVEIVDVQLPGKPGAYSFWSAQPLDEARGMKGEFSIS